MGSMRESRIVEPTSQVFDEAAVGFGSAIDKGVRRGRYLRGDLFVSAVANGVKPRSFVLDYGCGPGRISIMLARAGFRVLGLDPSPAMIATARQQPVFTPDVEFRVCPACPSDLSEIPCEAIVCSSVIEYVRKPEQLLQWFSATLRPPGILVISFANSRSIWRAWCRFRHTSGFRTAQRHVWSWPQFCRLLKRGGFAVEGHPVYFDSPLDRIQHFQGVKESPLGGTLGLIVARACRFI